MERSDERLSTRDLASGSSATDTEADRDTALADPAEAPPADTGAVRADRDDDLAAADMEPADARESEGADMAAADAGTSDAPYDRDTSAAPADDREVATDAGDRDVTAADAGARDRDAATTTDGDADAGQLLDESDDYQRRWEQIQGRFVDEPRGAVEDADALVATVMQRLAEGFAVERERLEAQWGRGEDISTEDLRVSLQRYRSFFQRLLST
jgi:hypothetical protein